MRIQIFREAVGGGCKFKMETKVESSEQGPKIVLLWFKVLFREKIITTKVASNQTLCIIELENNDSVMSIDHFSDVLSGLAHPESFAPTNNSMEDGSEKVTTKNLLSDFFLRGDGGLVLQGFDLSGLGLQGFRARSARKRRRRRRFRKFQRFFGKIVA